MHPVCLDTPTIRLILISHLEGSDLFGQVRYIDMHLMLHLRPQYILFIFGISR